MDTDIQKIPGLKLVAGTWRIRKVFEGQRIDMDTGSASQGIAERIMMREMARAHSNRMPPEPKWDDFVLSKTGKLWISSCYNTQKQSSKKRKMGFAVTRDQLREIARRSRGRCEFCFLPFQWTGASLVAGHQPWAPSFDRADPRKGYQFENIRLVLSIVNTCLMDWGDDALLRVCWAVYLSHNGASLAHGKIMDKRYFNDFS